MSTNLRPVLASHLRQRVEAFGEGFLRHNLALIGSPGSGKTFQLQQLMAQRPPHLLFVYCPLYRESCRSFIQRFLATVLQAGRAGSAPAPAQGRVGPGVPRTEAAVEAIEPLLVRRLYGEAFSRALDTIAILSDERGAPCVLILDEFLHLEDLKLVHAFHELGKRVMTWNTTLFILASSSPHRARTILRERLQLLFGQFEFLNLEGVDSAGAALWVQQELRGLRGAKSVGRFLLHWLGGSPWYLSLFLTRLKEVAALQHVSELSEPLFLQTAWDLLGNAQGVLHQWCVSRTEGLVRERLGARAMDALLQIAEGSRTATQIGQRIGRGGLSGVLQLLVEHDLAQRNGMCWMVDDPILRCWLSTVVSAQRTDAHADSRERLQRVERYLQQVWTQWSQAHELSFPERVTGLFTKFRDDTVSLDSKTGRLPAFASITTQAPPGRQAGTYLIADGVGKRWCASVQEGPIDETTIASFEEFCRRQTPRPARKVVITKAGLDEHARVLAKAVNMWVWETKELDLLMGLYGQI